MNSKRRIFVLLAILITSVIFAIGCSNKPVTEYNSSTITSIEQINELEKMAIAPPSMESIQGSAEMPPEPEELNR